MNRLLFSILFLLPFSGFNQVIANPELDDPICMSCIPASWQMVPDTDPACLATGPAQATVDIFDATGPNLPGGQNGNPFSGTAMVSGLHAFDGTSLTWHEGIMQTINGFTIGQTYSICFYQAVVKQQNCIDTSGSWQFYVDNTLITTTAPSSSLLSFDSNSIVWDSRTVTFTATATTHTIKFIPWDDDGNQTTSLTDEAGALRMGIDLVDFSVTVDPTIDPVASMCSTDPIINLTAADPGGTWTGTGITNATTGEFDPSVAGPGTWQIIYEITSTCGPVSDTLDITVTDCGTCDPSWTTTSLCSTDTPIDLNTLITGTTGGTWSGTGVTGSTFDPTGLSGPISIDYSVTAGCTDNLTQDIFVVDLNLTASGTDISCYGLADGSATVSVSGGVSYTYSWNTVPPQSGFTATNLGAGTYTVTVTEDASGCMATADVTITEPDSMTLILTNPTPCGSFGSAEVSVIGGTGPYTYSWDPTGATTSSIVGLSAGIYTVDVTDAFGCTQSSSIDVTINPFPIASISPFGATIGFGEEIQLVGSGGIAFSWFPDTGLSCSDCPDPVASPSITTLYCLAVMDDLGCTDTACMNIYVEYVCGEVFVPSAFSPNNDDNNDELCVIGNCIETMSFRIYDRWGEKVFESGDTELCWDGTFRGKPMSTGVYVYILEAELVTGETVVQEGNISLMR